MGRATITKDALIERKSSQNAPTVKCHMLLPTKGVQHTKTKHLDNMWWIIKTHMQPFYAKTRLPSAPGYDIHIFSRTTCEICSKHGHSGRSATGLLHKSPTGHNRQEVKYVSQIFRGCQNPVRCRHRWE